MLPIVDLDRLDDGQLMCRYADGNLVAFETLYARHKGPLWRFVLRRLRDETATADVFQDAWARVVANADKYRPTAPFGAWLYRIAHNCCVDHWRRSGRSSGREVACDDDMLASLPDRQTPGPDSQAMSQQALEALHSAVGQLPDEQRTAFLMFAEGGLSVLEIAEATGVGPETAKSRLRYAAAKLRQSLAGTERRSDT